MSRFSVILYFNVHLISFTKMEMVPKERSRWQVLYLKNISKKIFSPKAMRVRVCALTVYLACVPFVALSFQRIAYWSNDGQPWSEIRFNPEQTVMNSLFQSGAKCQGNSAEQWVVTIASPLKENILKRDFWLIPWVVILGSSVSCLAAGCDLFGNSKSCISLHFFCAAIFLSWFFQIIENQLWS